MLSVKNIWKQIGSEITSNVLYISIAYSDQNCIKEKLKITPRKNAIIGK